MRTVTRVIAVLAWTLVGGIAEAGVIDWNFTYTEGGVVTSALLVTSSTAGTDGGYDVLSMTGQRGGQAIQGLLSTDPNFNDNEIFANGPAVDQYGLAFVAGWQIYDIYYNTQGACGPRGYREDNGADYPYCNPNAPSVTNLSLKRTAVPEPATVVLMALGFVLVLAGRYLAPRRVRA